MKKVWVSFLGIIAMVAALLGLVACGGSQVTVAFESETVAMKVGDTRTLNVTVEGSEEAAVLTSDKTDVVSVDGYTLTAKAVGTAEITATVGSASAKCTVTVSEDDTIAVISLNYEEVELLKDKTITLEASLSYNAQPVTGTSFEWSENSNGAVVTLAPNGNKAVVTAVSFGNAKVTVRTTYRNKTIVAEATVRVKDNILLDVTNLTRESGEYNLNLTNNPQTAEEKSEFTPEVTVTKNGTEVADAEVTARLKSGTAAGVVSVEDGTITALKRGTAIVELVYSANGEEYVQEISVIVSVPTITANDTLYLEKSVGTKVITVAGAGEVSLVKLGEKTLEFTQDENEVTLTDFAAEDFGEATLTIETENMVWKSAAIVCTKAIGSAADWNAVAETIAENKLNGYYVLTCDIDYEGVAAPKFCQPTWGGEQGFAGTFDGLGHVIKNLTVSVTGEVGEGGHSFFGLTSSTAVIRNVGFLNAKIDASVNFRAGVVVGFHYGTIENVFVQVTNNSVHGGAFTQMPGAIANCVWGTIRNCVVEQLNTRSDSFGICSTSYVGCTIENCYSVGAGVLYRDGGDTPANATETDTLKNFANFAEMKEADLDLTAFSSEIWDTTSGVPVAKGHKAMVSANTAITSNTETPVLGTLEITGAANFVYTLKEEISGITISGNTVTVVGNYGATFTVVATHSLYTDITLEKEFTVANRSTVNLGTTDVDLSVGTLVLENISGTVEGVVANDQSATFTQNETTLTVTGLTGTAGATVSIVVTASESYYAVSALYVTKIVHSATEWNAVADTIAGNKLNGYYVLAGDLDFASVDAPKFCTPTWGGEQGFAGTFDGRGHVIKNFTVSVASGTAADGQSFFGLTATSANIRNVGFVNATIDSTANFRAAVISSFLYGTVENVFVQVTNNSGHSGAIAQTVWAGAAIRNCVVEQMNTRADSYALCWTSFAGCTIENSYSVGADVLYRDGGDNPANATETDTLKNFATAADMKAAELDLDDWDNTIWDTTSGMPVFRGTNA